MVNAGKGMCARETGAGFPCAYNKRPPEKAACGGPVLRNKTAVTKKKGTHSVCPFLFGDPYRIRTDVKGVRGLCLNHLTNGPYRKSPAVGSVISMWYTFRDSNPGHPD